MDHYQTLGVAKNATPDEIKKSYRRLASKHHPDKGGDTATFQKIEEAYRILSDPQQRQQYDNPMPQGFPGGFEFHNNNVNINDIFAQMFGQSFGQQTRRPQEQIYRTSISITLEQAYNGDTHILQLMQQRVPGKTTVKIDIPKGIDNGAVMRYEGLLDSAILMVEFRIQPHLKYERRGHDLYVTHPISVLDLIVGGKFEFTTISNKTLEVNIKPKTQPHMMMKIQGEGMPIGNTGQYGDQLILIKPIIPDIIDERIIRSIVDSKNQ